ncbi:hypothetical protein GWI33_006304 [Rhynchophorus ferrugineus]|uniref:Uncharacterized protein n=1 Tax=Rhynchophorus ferrugineus TaxID=354439 RepID=A0A834MHG5_RHYFE|nr:hypothetical protein GWI33_006304 [Rhynchophorus ferrugineus]
MEKKFSSTLEDYYRRFVDLQEKLKKSEEQRFVMEKKFNDMVLVAKEEEQMHYRRLRSQYKKFLEEDRKRQSRNEQIIRNLERVETRISMLSAKTERIDELRKQYQIYLQRMCEHRPHSKMIPPIKRSRSRDLPSYHPDKATQTMDIQSSLFDRPSLSKCQDNESHNEKLEILDHYLQNLSSQRCRDEVLSEESPIWSNDYQAGTSNQATVIADDIMNSIYSRYYNKSDILPSNKKSDDAVDKTDSRLVPDNNKNTSPEIYSPGKKEEKETFNKTELLLQSRKQNEVVDKNEERQELVEPTEKYPENVILDETPEKSSFKLVESSRGLFEDTSSGISKEQPRPVILDTEKEEEETPTVNVTLEHQDQFQIGASVTEMTFHQQESINPLEETSQYQAKLENPVEEQTKNPENVTFNSEVEAQPIESTINQQYIQNDQFSTPQDLEIDQDQSDNPEISPTGVDQTTDAEQPPVQKCDDDEVDNPPVEEKPINDTPQPDQKDDHDQENQVIAEPDPVQQVYYDENNQQMVYDQGGVDYEQSLQPGQEQLAQYDDQSALYDQDQSLQYEQNGQPVQYDENGQLIDQYNQYQQQVFYDQNGQIVQPQFDESGQMIPQYDENGQVMVVYDQNGQQYFGEQYDQSQQQYYNYTEQEQAQFDAEQYDQYQANEPQQPDGENMENLAETPAEPEPEAPEQVNPEEEVKTANVMEMLDTDTESVKQNVSKVSNESDFDFS